MSIKFNMGYSSYGCNPYMMNGCGYVPPMMYPATGYLTMPHHDIYQKEPQETVESKNKNLLTYAALAVIACAGLRPLSKGIGFISKKAWSIVKFPFKVVKGGIKKVCKGTGKVAEMAAGAVAATAKGTKKAVNSTANVAVNVATKAVEKAKA